MAVDADAIRAEIRAWLGENWDPELPLREWRDRLVDAGWAAPTWPAAWHGRDLPRDLETVVDEEMARAGAVSTPAGVGMGLAAPTILTHGPDEVKALLLRPILTGEHTWCQLFSEPGSGSDLAGLTTRAERDGDEFVVNGQKVWNTSAHHADYGLLLARTDWDAPKHRGITCFALPMQQPGVEVRPLRQMNGYASFNEVFLTDARVPAANVIGAVNDGWAAAVTTLSHERRAFHAFGRRPRVPATTGRAAREAQAETDDYFKTYEWYPSRSGRVDLVVDRARETGAHRDPIARQRIAALLSFLRVTQWSAARGVHGSIGKLAASHLARTAAEVHTAITGPAAMLAGPDAPAGGVITEVLVSVPAISIAGGTDEIQRNIIGERILGLPKEPQVDRDLPFRDVPRNAR